MPTAEEQERQRLIEWLGHKLRANGLVLSFVEENGNAHCLSWSPKHKVPYVHLDRMLRAARHVLARIEDALHNNHQQAETSDESDPQNVHMFRRTQ